MRRIALAVTTVGAALILLTAGAGQALDNGTLVADAWPGTEWSRPEVLTASAGKAYFRATDGDWQNGGHGSEPWVTDGTLAGSFMLQDVMGGSSHSRPSSFVNAGSLTFFTADDGVHGREVWVTDGTQAGTHMVEDVAIGQNSTVFDSNRPLGSLDGKAYFVAFGELWRSDGTEPDTYQVKEIKPGIEHALPFHPEYAVYNGKLYFAADDGTHGRELWSSNGTEAGTTLVRDAVLGSTGSNPAYFVEYAGKLYFWTQEHGLWRTDGTFAGTEQMTAEPPYGPSPTPTMAVGNGLLFMAETSGELWATDTTPLTGVHLVKDLSSLTYHPEQLVNVAGTVYFLADDGSGNARAFWKTDGTDAGTVLVRDFTPDNQPPNFEPGRLTLINGALYFSAPDPTYGKEPWRLDGSGFTLLGDVNPGIAGSAPREFALVNGRLVMTAERPDVGFEVFSLSGSPTAVSVRSFRAVRTGGLVSLCWRTGSEVGLLGFNVYRTQGHGRARLNGTLIPARGGPQGRSYAYWARAAGSRFWLEEVHTTGARRWHGPIRATR